MGLVRSRVYCATISDVCFDHGTVLSLCIITLVLSSMVASSAFISTGFSKRFNPVGSQDASKRSLSSSTSLSELKGMIAQLNADVNTMKVAVCELQWPHKISTGAPVGICSKEQAFSINELLHNQLPQSKSPRTDMYNLATPVSSHSDEELPKSSKCCVDVFDDISSGSLTLPRLQQ